MTLDQSKHDASGQLKNGGYEERFKVGSLMCVGEYRDGEKTGEWKWYRENGELMQTGSFNDDEKKAGIWRRYHPNGALYDEGEYADDRKVGEWRVYDNAGNLLKTTRHKASKPST